MCFHLWLAEFYSCWERIKKFKCALKICRSLSETNHLFVSLRNTVYNFINTLIFSHCVRWMFCNGVFKNPPVVYVLIPGDHGCPSRHGSRNSLWLQTHNRMIGVRSPHSLWLWFMVCKYHTVRVGIGHASHRAFFLLILIYWSEQCLTSLTSCKSALLQGCTR